MTTAAELIRDAYSLSLVLDPEEEMSGVYASTGLSVLNNIITQWSSLPSYLQSYSIETISVLTGDYTYSVSPLITQFLEGHLYDSENVMSNLYQVDLKRHNTLNYLLSETGQARPNKIYIENPIVNVPPQTIQTASTVYFFPVPDQNYTATLYVKKVLGTLTQSQTITEISTAYYKPFLYQIAKDLSAIFSSVLSPGFHDEYDKLMRELKAANKRDMTVINTNPFGFHGRRYRPWSTYAE